MIINPSEVNLPILKSRWVNLILLSIYRLSKSCNWQNYLNTIWQFDLKVLLNTTLLISLLGCFGLFFCYTLFGRRLLKWFSRRSGKIWKRADLINVDWSASQLLRSLTWITSLLVSRSQPEHWHSSLITLGESSLPHCKDLYFFSHILSTFNQRQSRFI